METVLISLIAGVFLGRFAKTQVLKVNNLVFSILSTLFVFIMGVSLGLSRSTFSGVSGILINSLAIAIIASIGSILCTNLLGTLIIKKQT